MFLKHFEHVLNENIKNDGEGWTIVDVFGGSGLLSHNAKHIKPQARVIYNDFDGYSERIKNIKDTNKLRKEIINIIGDEIPQKKCLDNQIKEKIINKINDFKGYKDVNCIASWLLFSGKQVATLEELFNCGFYNRVRKTDYATAEDYLDGIEVVNESFHQLLPRFNNKEKVLFILDPPYLCTHQESYKQDTYFDLIDFLRLINLVKPPFIFFSSTKSEFISFIDYMRETKIDNWQSFENAERIIAKTSNSHSGKYEDNMIYKF